MLQRRLLSPDFCPQAGEGCRALAAEVNCLSFFIMNLETCVAQSMGLPCSHHRAWKQVWSCSKVCAPKDKVAVPLLSRATFGMSLSKQLHQPQGAAPVPHQPQKG